MAIPIHKRFPLVALSALLSIAVIANTGLAQHDQDAGWAVGDGEFSADAEAIPDPAVESCNCGNSKHCPGVCRDPGFPRKPICEKPGDRDRGDCPPKRYRICNRKRAGNPDKVAPWAQCSITQKYSVWFVGGGASFCKGRPKKQSEGTWGMDYGGLFGKAKVWLNYTNNRKQGGEGAYETDGEPELISKVHHLLHGR